MGRVFESEDELANVAVFKWLVANGLMAEEEVVKVSTTPCRAPSSFKIGILAFCKNFLKPQPTHTLTTASFSPSPRTSSSPTSFTRSPLAAVGVLQTRVGTLSCSGNSTNGTGTT